MLVSCNPDKLQPDMSKCSIYKGIGLSNCFCVFGKEYLISDYTTILWLCNLKSSTLFQTHRNSLTSNSISTEKTDIVNEPIPLYIEHLDMSGCNLSGLQLTSIAKHLQKASKCTLKYLDFSHNKISHNAALEIANFISSNSILEKLTLSNCDLY